MEAGGRFYRLLVCPKPDETVFDFDDEGRVKKETYSGGFTRDFTYNTNQTLVTGSNGINITYNLNAFGEVAEYKLQNGENNKNYSYTYDSDGNITTISLNGSLQQTFTYNSSNELVRVDDAVVNKTVTYDYDYVGNITFVKTYIYTTGTLGTPLTTQNYTYNSQNQRTDLSYDLDGNMTALNGYNFTWTNRRLTSVVNEDTNISYTYNHNGIRTSKTVNGVTTNYTVDENNNIIEQTDGTNTIKFVYDSSNSPIYFTYNNTTYYYEKNLQGDIVAILDANGNTVVEYTYDIWGKLLGITGSLADTIGAINPLRYRGYYYDTETGLYYLQSRYYSPDLMRFISQDDPVLSNDQGEPLGSNLYAYCLNNPVMNSDYTGTDAIILQSHESVFNFGHMGLLFQYKNNWYYWYWGLHSTIAPLQYGITALVGLSGTFKATTATRNFAVSAALLSFTVWRTLTKTVYAQYKLVKVGSSSSITSDSTLYTIDEMLKKANAGYASVFERGLYIKGDFSKAYNYLKVQTFLRAYNLIYNNCMQTCISALYQGKFASNNFKNHIRLLLAKNMIVPKLAYNYLKNYYTSLAWSGRR